MEVYQKEIYRYQSTRKIGDVVFAYSERIFHIFLFGVGGTGSNFAIKAMKLLYGLMETNQGVKIRMTFIDGDHVEKGNLLRQHFTEQDIYQNKAEVFFHRYAAFYPIEMTYVDRYLENAEEVLHITGRGDEGVIPVIIGAVDNHATRQVLHQVFNEFENGFYLDAGNSSFSSSDRSESGYATGQVVLGVRANGETVVPPAGFFYPNFLTERDKFKSEIGCGEEEGSEQVMIANDCAAGHLTVFLHQILIAKRIITHYVTFDALSGFSRPRYLADLIEAKGKGELSW